MVPQDPFAACDPLRPIRDHLYQAWRALDAELREEILTVALLAAVPRPGQVYPGRSPAHLQTWPTHQPAAAAPSPPAAR